MAQWQKVSQRTVKCRTCNVRDYYLYSDGQRSELRDRDGAPHVCKGTVVPFPVVTTVEAPAPAPTAQPTVTTIPANAVSAAPAPAVQHSAHALTDSQLAELRALIPDPAQAKSYIPRKLNGKTDVEMLLLAYKVNTAHAQGQCVPECSQHKPKGYTCKRRPQNVLLISDTGAGKNHLVRAVAAILQIPYLRIPLNGGATVDGLLGRLKVYEQNGASITEWQDGRLSLMLRPENPYGGIVCLDEVNATPQSIGFILHPILDDERTCVIDDNSEAFKVNPKAMFVGTMNPDYAGTRTMNAALKSRFSIPLILDYEDSIEKKIVADDRLLKLAKQLRQQYRNGDGTIGTPVGTRTLLDYESNLQLYGREIANAAFTAAFETTEEQVTVRRALELHLADAAPIDLDADVNLDDPAN